MTSSPTVKERLLADILDELRALRRELQASPRPVITWMADSHGAHRGPAGEYRVGWQADMHGEKECRAC